MAMVERTHLLRLHWRDNDGAESWSQIYLSATTDYTIAIAHMLTMRDLAVALSSAACFGADFSIRYAENTAPAPAAESDNDRHGVFIFGADPDALAIVRVPSIRESLLLASGPYAGIALDQDAPALAVFIEALASGIAGVVPCDPLAADLGALATAYMQRS